MNKIKVGFFSFSQVAYGQHVSYNRWHATDHMPENRALPGIAHAQRWVAPPAYIKARLANDPTVALAQYMTCYLMTDPVEQTVKDFLLLGARMRELGRFNQHGRFLLGGPFNLLKAYVAPGAVVSAESLPYRPHSGVLAMLGEMIGEDGHGELSSWYDRVHIPDMMTLPGVSGVYWFTNTGTPQVNTFEQPTSARRFLHLYFLENDPLETMAQVEEALPRWRAARRLLDTSDLVKPLLLGPFRPMVPLHYEYE